MNLSQEQRESIIKISIGYLRREREVGFSCVDFVRLVYRQIGIDIPLLMPKLPPPSEINIKREDLGFLPLGEIIFLRDRSDGRPRPWTHVGIVYSPFEIIHCSLFFGGCVVITPIQLIWERYDFVESL